MKLRTLIAASLAIGIAGCGGSSGGPSGVSMGQVNQANTVSSTQNLSIMAALATAGTDFNSLQTGSGNLVQSRVVLRSGCPTVSDNRTSPTQPIPDPSVVTVDYGSGCSNNAFNKTISGSATTTFTGFSQNPQNPTGTAAMQFNNLTVNGSTLTGTATLHVTSSTSGQLTADVTQTTSSLTRHVVLNVALTLAGSGSSRTITVNGTGTYSDSAIGSFDLTFSNVQFTRGCSDPTSGVLTITGASHISAAVTFGPACGNACARINNGPSTCFNL